MSHIFKYSMDNKRYHTWNYHLRNKFNHKVFKVSLNAGFTCPNINGPKGNGGCIFCSANGSGDFAGNPTDSLKKQFEELLKEFTDVLGSTLSENQRFVLLSVIKSCKKSGQAFISLKKIYKIAKKEGIGSDQTKEIINYLIGKNLIEAWISPPQSKWEDGGRSNEIK